VRPGAAAPSFGSSSLSGLSSHPIVSFNQIHETDQIDRIDQTDRTDKIDLIDKDTARPLLKRYCGRCDISLAKGRMLIINTCLSVPFDFFLSLDLQWSRP
jgi:hypothetical protein